MAFTYQTEETLSGLFFAQAEKFKHDVFLRAKIRNGSPADEWVDMTWSDCAKEVRRAGAGLLDLGVEKGDRVAIFADNQPRWIISDQAIQGSGAMGVPIYPTSTDRQLSFILNDSKAKGIITGDEKLMEQAYRVKEEVPSLEFIACMSTVDDPPDGAVLGFDELMEKGIKSDGGPERFDETRKNLKPDDTAAIIYTSGTTGEPKGAVLTHKNFMRNIDQVLEATLVQKTMERGVRFECLCHLPLCHVYGRTTDYHTQMAMNGIVTFAESYQKVPENLLEVRPNMINSIPRLYEKVYEVVQMQSAKMKGPQKKVFDWAMKVGRKVVDYMAEGKRIDPATSVQFVLSGLLVYDRIRKLAGMDRLVMATSGGGALSKEINYFFRSMNIQIAEGYGLTETSPVLTWNALEFSEPLPDTRLHKKALDWLLDTMVVAQSKGKNPAGNPLNALKLATASNLVIHHMVMKPGTVGRPCRETEIKIAADGEILARGPQVFDRDKGYFNRPDLTDEAFTEDGFYKTGDIGYFDKDGFMVITDRKKELLVTAGGKNVAPHPIELDLTLDPYIEQAIVVGDGCKYLSALIVPSFENLEKWAHKSAIKYSNREELVNKPEVREIYDEKVKKVNEELPRYEQLKRFRLLPVEFTEEGGELTPTMKMKRRVIYDKFADEINKCYE